MTRRDWRLEDERILRARWIAGVPSEAIGRELNRTDLAVRKRASVLGLQPRKWARWTPGQDRVISDTTDGLIDTLARRLNRTPGAIRARIMRSLCGHDKRQKAKLLEVA